MFWIIFCSILLILLILLFSPLGVNVEYINDKLKVTLNYLFIRKKLSAGRKSKKTEKSDKDKEDKSSKTKKAKKKSGKTASEKIEFYKKIAKAGGKALKRITKNIKIKGIYIDFTISDLDAYECAIKFGKMNIIVYNILSYLGNFVKLRKKSINIRCIYNQPKCIYNLKFKISVTPAVLIMTAIAFIFAFLVNNKKAANKAKVTAKTKTA